MNEETKKQVSELVKSVMGVDINKISPKTRFDQITEWDSFNNLMLISKMQEKFGVEFTAVEIEETKNVGQLFWLMGKKEIKK